MSGEEETKSFADLGLCEPLREACDALGFKAPTDIQKEALPYALEGRDIIGLAQTGSGKTTAFALPVLQSLLKTPRGLFCLCIAPTRELAKQIRDQFEALGAGIGIKCALLIGGVDPMSEAIVLGKKPHVIIGTPGRVVYHLENTKGFTLKFLQYFVLDEADKLFELDFEEQINQILDECPKNRTTYLYSATMTSKVKKLQRASLNSPVKVEVCSKYSTVNTLQQQYLFIPAKFKDCYIAFILNEFAGNSIIVFTSTCNTCMKLSLMLRNLGFGAVALHGKLSQTKRFGALNKFKSGDRKILIATDVASRGLDIPSVDLVINYDIPANSKDYVHRVGRTARAGRSGRSLVMVTQYDIEQFQKIEKAIGLKMKVFPTEEEMVLVMLDRVSEAQRIAIKELKENQATGNKRTRDEADFKVKSKNRRKKQNVKRKQC